MADYIFTATTKENAETSGTLFANDKEAALKILGEKGLTVTRLEPVAEKGVKVPSGLSARNTTIKGEELLTFTQELGAMLNAGIPLHKAMDTMVDDIEAPALQGMLREIDQGLAGGAPLSELLKRYPKAFSKLYVSMVAAGETGGNLPQTLIDLASYIEKMEQLRRRVVTALYYPTVVVSFAFIMVALVLLVGVPRFAAIYDSLGLTLPGPTLFFVAIGNFFMQWWYLFLLFAVILYFAIRNYGRTEAGQLFFDTIKLKMYIFGPLYRRLSIARFARTLGTLYGSGVNIINALEVVAGSTGNRVMEMTVIEAMRNLKEGDTITAPLRRSKVFTPMAISMIAAGEESGTLHNMLWRLADFYETQVDLTLQALSGLLEPLVIIVIGIVIGTIILLLGLPILQLGSMVH